MPERILVTTLILGLGVEAWRGWGKAGDTPFPLPSLFVGVAIVFSILGVVAAAAPALAAALAVAWLVGLLAFGRNPIAPNLGAAATRQQVGPSPGQTLQP